MSAAFDQHSMMIRLNQDVMFGLATVKHMLSFGIDMGLQLKRMELCTAHWEAITQPSVSSRKVIVAKDQVFGVECQHLPESATNSVFYYE